MDQVIPHINLLYELEDSTTSICEIIEPLYSYFYVLNTKAAKDRNRPSGFFFILEDKYRHPLGLSSFIDLYRYVTNSLIILEEIEKHKEEFKEFSNLNSWLSTVIALKSQISDISPEIQKLKADNGVVSTRAVAKKLFLFTESVRALLEELMILKKILLDEVIFSKKITLTKEPLDVKGDLE